MLTFGSRTKPAPKPSVPARPAKTPPQLMVTLWPSFTHFDRFAKDRRLAGIRLNSAMLTNANLDNELEIVKQKRYPVPLYFDFKARQLRITEVSDSKARLEIKLNHRIEVETPTPVLFKAGADECLLEKIEDDWLIFRGGPYYNVLAGESIHVRHPSLKVFDPIYTPQEIEKIEKVVAAGFSKYFLSYVEDFEEIKILRSYIGPDAELILKIESKRGLDFVKNKYTPQPNTRLMAARGDLYVELDRPHDILQGCKTIIEKDPNAIVGSRILLSIVQGPVPECSDFSDLAWLNSIGYQTMLLCDELCLKEDLLATAVNVFQAFQSTVTG